MLPGIRFLLAAIFLSMSILIFGLGAAALLRAAHEEVASVPTRRVMPEPVFAQQVEAPPPTLALLRIEPAAPAKAPETLPAAIAAPEPAPEAVPVPKVDEEKLAVVKLDDIAPVEAAKPEAAATPETILKSETAAAESPAPPSAAAEPPAAEPKLAALDAAPVPPIEAVPVPPEQIVPPVTASPVSSTKTAALGDPAAKIEKPAEAGKANEKADLGETRKQKRAERARERRRLAARRAKRAAQQAAAQQAVDPFSQTVQQMQPATTATATTRRR